MTPSVKISNDGRDLPIAIAVNHVAPVALLEQLGIKPVVIRPRAGMRSDTRLARCLGHLLVA